MAIAGRDVLLKYNTGTVQAPTWVTLAGLRTRSMRLNNEPVDVTTSDSAGGWRVLAGGMNIKTMDISGDGIFDGSAAQLAVETANRTGVSMHLEVTVPELGTYVFDAFISGLEIDAPHDGPATFSCSFMSSGAVTFTAEL